MNLELHLTIIMSTIVFVAFCVLTYKKWKKQRLTFENISITLSDGTDFEFRIGEDSDDIIITSQLTEVDIMNYADDMTRYMSHCLTSPARFETIEEFNDYVKLGSIDMERIAERIKQSLT